MVVASPVPRYPPTGYHADHTGSEDGQPTSQNQRSGSHHAHHDQQRCQDERERPDQQNFVPLCVAGAGPVRCRARVGSSAFNCSANSVSRRLSSLVSAI